MFQSEEMYPAGECTFQLENWAASITATSPVAALVSRFLKLNNFQEFVLEAKINHLR